MSVQQFCLRWNNHQPNFISVCSSLLHNGTLVDVTLAAEGNQLQAHKIVLSACSSYFQSLFTMNPCQHPIVILKDVQYDHLRTMVDFMYYGEVNVSQDQLPHILKTAEMLKIKGLAEMPTDPANLIRSDSKSANDTTELVGTAASTSAPSNSGGAGGGNTNSNGGGLVNSGSAGLSGTLWSNSESQFHAQQQPQQHQSQQSAQHQTQPQQHHQQLQQQQQHHNQQQQHQQQQLHTQLQNSQTQISQQHQQQQQQQQQQHHHHHQQIRRTPSPLGAGASPAARRKRIRKSSNNGSGERNNSDDQHNSGLETGPGGGLTLSQMSQMSFGGGASTSGLSGLATHSLHTAKLLKEAANNDMETHPQDSDSLDDTHGHVHIQIKPEVDITGIQQSIPLDISGATTPSEHDAPNTQSAHSECTAAFINTEAATDDNNMNVSLNQKQQQQQSMAMGSKRNRVLTRQPRVKRDSDSLSSHHVSPEPSTCSKTLDTDLLPSTTSSSSISGQTRTLFVSTQGHHRQHHLLTVPPRIERHSSEPAPSLSPSSPHLLSVPQNTPFLIKQHSDPLPPSQYSANHLSGVVGVMGNTLTNPFAPLHRQYSHPLASSGIAAGYVATSAPLQPSQHISLPEAIYASTSPPPVGSSQYIVPIQNISHQHNTSSSSSAINVYPTIERYSPTTTSPTKVLMSAAMGEQEQATITNVASCNATTVNNSTTVPTTINNNNSSNLNPKFRFSRSLQTHSSSTSSSTSGIHTSAGSSSFEQISHLRVRTEELQRSVSSPQTSREMITLENPRSSHCPVIRPGPALGCNFCWNTIDGHGRILRRKTKYHCPECQTNLCIVPCFQEYHERVNNETSTATTKQSTASTMHNTNNSNNQMDNRTRQHYTKTETI